MNSDLGRVGLARTGSDITLWPGESQAITVTWNSADLQGATPVVSVSGWNTPKLDVVAA